MQHQLFCNYKLRCKKSTGCRRISHSIASMAAVGNLELGIKVTQEPRHIYTSPKNIETSTLFYTKSNADELKSLHNKLNCFSLNEIE